MVESLAQQRGLIATFMPKPFANLTGNGCHFHVSLWSNGENVFERDPADDPRGLGLSELAYQFIGGLKANAKAYIAVTAPTVNSYKRLVVGAPTSGATWAPAYVSYGYNNRTQMLRIPAGRADRGPHRRRLLQPVPGGDRDARGRARRDRARAGRRRAELGQPVRDASRRARGGRNRAAAGQPARRRPRARAQRRRSAPRSARPATATTSTTSRRSSGASGRPRTSRSPSGSSTATCSCSDEVTASRLHAARGIAPVSDAERCAEPLDDVGIELGAGAAPKLGHRADLVHRLAVGPVGRHRVERVAHRDDPRAERDLAARRARRGSRSRRSSRGSSGPAWPRARDRARPR